MPDELPAEAPSADQPRRSVDVPARVLFSLAGVLVFACVIWGWILVTTPPDAPPTPAFVGAGDASTTPTPSAAQPTRGDVVGADVSVSVASPKTSATAPPTSSKQRVSTSPTTSKTPLSTPARATPKSGAPPSTAEYRYEVVSNSEMVVQYTSVGGKTFNYTSEPGRWHIMAPPGGQITATTVDGGDISCSVLAGSKAVAGESGVDGVVLCAS